MMAGSFSALNQEDGLIPQQRHSLKRPGSPFMPASKQARSSLEASVSDLHLVVSNDDCEKTEAEARNSLGDLERFPNELYASTLNCLDVQSLVNFALVNKRAKTIIDSLPSYKELTMVAPDSLRALISLRCARYFSIDRLHQELYSPTCVNCGKPGDILYLLTCDRACYMCLTSNERFLPLTIEDACVLFGLRHQDITHLPTVCSLSGCDYGTREARDAHWVDFTSAKEVGLKLHGSLVEMNRFVAAEREEKRKAWGTAYNGTKRLPPLAPFPKSRPDTMDCNPNRFVCAVQFPGLDRRDRLTRVALGYSCGVCGRNLSDMLEVEKDANMPPDGNNEREPPDLMYLFYKIIPHLYLCGNTPLRSLQST